MALTVDPTGLDPDADALIDRAYFLAWASKYGYDVAAYDGDTQVDPAIRRASDYIATLGLKGSAVGVQAFPRTDLTDGSGAAVAADIIPTAVQRATALISYQELLVPGSMNPVLAGGLKAKRVKVDVVEKEYFTPSGNVEDERAKVLAADALLSGFMNRTTTNSLVGTSVRG